LCLDVVATYDEPGWIQRKARETSNEDQRARNILKGTIVEIVKGATTAHVRIDIGGAVVTASITNEAVADLKLEEGKQAYAVVKASDVMVGID
jgi:molybdopterin-binding protein